MILKWKNWEEIASTTFKAFPKVGEWELRPFGMAWLLAHVLAFPGYHALLTGQTFLNNFLFLHCVNMTCAYSVIAGSHRLFTHRSYKAKLPLRFLLAIGHSISGFLSVIDWCRVHRLHHKFSETDADPHNSTRGFFFSHMGWVLLKEHPEVEEKAKTMDFSDLHRDPVLRFQHRYHYLLELIFSQLIPVLFPYYYWDIDLYTCFVMNASRMVTTFHVAMLGNSIAHSCVIKPFEKRISPSDTTLLSLFVFGEGWHNYHHVFPWDYRNTDIGFHLFNGPRIFIELMAKIGLAYDLKTVPEHVIKKRAARTGDGSYHPTSESKKVEMNGEGSEELELSRYSDKTDTGGHNPAGEGIGPGAWGWGDSDIPQEDIAGTIVSNSKEEHED